MIKHLLQFTTSKVGLSTFLKLITLNGTQTKVFITQLEGLELQKRERQTKGPHYEIVVSLSY